MEDHSTIEDYISPTGSPKSSISRKNASLVSALLTMLLLIIAVAVFGISKNLNTKRSEKPTVEKFMPLANGTVVYGYWTNQSSVIRAFDLSSGKEGILATLGRDIKHVKVINNHTISYIHGTDVHDYGKSLVIRNVEKNIEEVIISSDQNFGIDDYVISPSGEFGAVWMVGTSGQKNQFVGSASRVYSINITSKTKNLIYDETTANGNSVHYPIAITNEGQLFTDRFIPNSGAGWAYGMSVSDFSGRKKTDIDIMKNGTYSTQPVVSPDGTYLGFAGYSGSDGTVLVSGFRKALTIPNTVELLDLKTLDRKKVDTGISGSLYPFVGWDTSAGELLIKTVQKKSDNIFGATYLYIPRLDSLKKIQDVPQLDFISNFGDGKYLMGQEFQDSASTGNLGSSYSQSINKLYVVSADSQTTLALPISQSPIQLIGIKPSNYFPSVENTPQNDAISKQQLRLQTFDIKPALAPKRSTQQSTPPTPETPTAPDLPQCRTISYPQCNQLLGKNYPTSKDIGELNDSAFSDCVWKVQAQGEAKSTCLDSPLYLYGTSGTNVKVRVDTAITNPNVTMKDNLISSTLANNGTILVNGQMVQSISFDYVSRMKNITRPTEGWIVSQKEKMKKINEIGREFGLNQKEIEDILSQVNKINSAYIFISFFDHNTSQNILPLYFDPMPKSYRNTVFYFKKLDALPSRIPHAPTIDPIQRIGLTAIEISYMTE